jgi:hypothetical protein
MSGAVLDGRYLLIKVDEEIEVRHLRANEEGYGILYNVYLVFDNRGVIRYVVGDGSFLLKKRSLVSKTLSEEEFEGFIYSSNFRKMFRLRDFLVGRVKVKDLRRFVSFDFRNVMRDERVHVEGDLSDTMKLEKGGLLKFMGRISYPFEVVFESEWEVEGKNWDGVLEEVHIAFNSEGEVEYISGLGRFTEYEYVGTREYEYSPPEDKYIEYDSEEVVIDPSEPFDLQDVLQGVVNEHNCVEFLNLRVVSG